MTNMSRYVTTAVSRYVYEEHFQKLYARKIQYLDKILKDRYKRIEVTEDRRDKSAMTKNTFYAVTFMERNSKRLVLPTIEILDYLKLHLHSVADYNEPNEIMNWGNIKVDNLYYSARPADKYFGVHSKAENEGQPIKYMVSISLGCGFEEFIAKHPETALTTINKHLPIIPNEVHVKLGTVLEYDFDQVPLREWEWTLPRPLMKLYADAIDQHLIEWRRFEKDGKQLIRLMDVNSPKIVEPYVSPYPIGVPQTVIPKPPATPVLPTPNIHNNVQYLERTRYMWKLHNLNFNDWERQFILNIGKQLNDPKFKLTDNQRKSLEKMLKKYNILETNILHK